MGTVTLQTIFQDAFPAYEQTHPLPAHVRRAARAIMQCRTAALGGHIQACPDGHMSRIWYNSCRHRSCPQCAYLQTERWLALQRARLLACDHYHVIFTLPHDLNPLWLANVPVMTTLLFQAVRDTLGSLLADPEVPRRAAGHPGGAAHLESDPGAASARALPGHRGRADPGGAVEGGAQRLSAAGARGHGGVSGQAARRDPPGPGPGGLGAARGDPAAAVAQPPDAPRASPQDQMERAHPGALPPRRGGGDVSGAVSARWPPQERPAGGLGRRRVSPSPAVPARRRPTGAAPRPSG